MKAEGLKQKAQSLNTKIIIAGGDIIMVRGEDATHSMRLIAESRKLKAKKDISFAPV